MGRMSEKKLEIEAQRLELLHAEQRKLRKRLTKEVKVKKAGPHLPGETRLKKNMAVLFKVGVPGISYTDIGARLGETKKTVKNWFQYDPEVKEFYEFVTDNLKTGALEYIKTYSLEAVETLSILMRFGSEKYMFESARDILDRVGVAKVSRSEIEAEHTTKHTWGDRDSLVEEVRQLSPEHQEQAIKVIEQLEELLANNSDPGNDSDEPDDDSSLDAIRSDDDDEDDD